MIKLLEAIIPFAITLIGKWISKKEKDDQIKEKYVDFIKHIEKQENRSRKMQRTIEELKKKLDGET